MDDAERLKGGEASRRPGYDVISAAMATSSRSAAAR